MEEVKTCYICKEIVTFCSCGKSITDKDEYIKYLESIRDKVVSKSILQMRYLLKTKKKIMDFLTLLVEIIRGVWDAIWPFYVIDEYERGLILMGKVP